MLLNRYFKKLFKHLLEAPSSKPSRSRFFKNPNEAGSLMGVSSTLSNPFFKNGKKEATSITDSRTHSNPFFKNDYEAATSTTDSYH